ncbi:MAG: SHOCT domain-containing protein [Streptococcaceae bacterium]|jgi:hypothetical protein|nr:SHOCT domain-containing protein [Streptococcaceae bacterium]
MVTTSDKSKSKLTPVATATLAGKLGSSVIDNGTDLLKTFYDKSGESKKVAAIKEWEVLRDNGTISEEDFQLKVNSLLGKKPEKESLLNPKKLEKLESVLKIETLRKYKELLVSETLTEEQFAHQKQLILAEKLPKNLEVHEIKIEAVQLYEQLKKEEVLTNAEFEKMKDRIFGISHSDQERRNLINKVTSLFPKRREKSEG